MDRRTFVKVGCIGSASLLVQGLDPMMRADAVPVAIRRLNCMACRITSLPPSACQDCFPDE